MSTANLISFIKNNPVVSKLCFYFFNRSLFYFIKNVIKTVLLTINFLTYVIDVLLENIFKVEPPPKEKYLIFL
jgi:hypothetical protein